MTLGVVGAGATAARTDDAVRDQDSVALPDGGAAPLFHGLEPIAVTFSGPLRRLLRDAGDDRREWPFSATLPSDATVPVDIRVRSNFRRGECTFPPLRLDFPKRQLAGTVFEGQNKLKLVTHCRNLASYETNTLEEYVAYRILRRLTDVSFQVRLLRVTYVDTGASPTPDTDASANHPSTTRWAFVIEDAGALAARLGGQHIEPPHVRPDTLNADHAAVVGLFQYLIANTDFSLVAPLAGRSCCHNSKLIQTPQALYSVPYDFDMSGLINARYAGGNPVVSEPNVRRRIYRGYCTDRATLERAIAHFAPLRDAIEAEFARVPEIGATQIERAMRYVDRFFERLKGGAGHFERRCLPP